MHRLSGELVRFQKSLFIICLLGFVFALGMHTAARQWPPFTLFRTGVENIKAIKVWLTESQSTAKLVRVLDDGQDQRRVIKSGQAGDEYLLVAGGLGQWSEHCPTYGCLAAIINRDGSVVHTWDFNPDEIFDGSQHVGLSAQQVYPSGVYLSDSGDLLVSFQNQGGYPYSYGMAKYSFDGTLLWNKVGFDHHWFDVSADGSIYSPVLRIVAGSLTVAGKELKCLGGSYYEDYVRVYSASGEILNEYSMLELLRKSGFDALLSSANDPCDPTHLNDIRLLDASEFGLNDRDTKLVILSLRNINSVAIADLSTFEILWIVSGLTREQHSPRMFHDGVVVFDNYAGQNRSEIVSIHPGSFAKTIVYPRTEGTAFYSDTAGYIDLSDDGRRAIVSETKAGRILEIDMQTGSVLWEFLNLHQARDSLEVPSLDAAKGRFAVFSTSCAVYIPRTLVERLL